MATFIGILFFFLGAVAIFCGGQNNFSGPLGGNARRADTTADPRVERPVQSFCMSGFRPVSATGPATSLAPEQLLAAPEVAGC